MERIDPTRLYSFSEARHFFTSCRGGPIGVRSLHRWRKEGSFQGVPRQSGKKVYWFVWGAELVRLLGESAEAPPEPPSSPKERQEAQERALRLARALGYSV